MFKKRSECDGCETRSDRVKKLIILYLISWLGNGNIFQPANFELCTSHIAQIITTCVAVIVLSIFDVFYNIQVNINVIFFESKV